MEKKKAAVPLVCHGHSRPVVDLFYSPVTPDGYFLISASKGKPSALSPALAVACDAWATVSCVILLRSGMDNTFAPVLLMRRILFWRMSNGQCRGFYRDLMFHLVISVRLIVQLKVVCTNLNGKVIECIDIL